MGWESSMFIQNVGLFLTDYTASNHKVNVIQCFCNYLQTILHTENALNSSLSIICCAVCGLQTCTGRYNVKVFCIVFIFCAFNAARDASGFIASTCKMIHEWCTWKALEWNDYRGCMGGELLRYTSMSIHCVRDEVWKRALPNTKKYCPVNREVDFKLRCYGHGTWSFIILIFPTPCVIINIS